VVPGSSAYFDFLLYYSFLVHDGRDQIEQLTGKSAPEDFIEELMEIASSFDDPHGGRRVPRISLWSNFLVELEVVMPARLCCLNHTIWSGVAVRN
jgi:hypothetical protein